MRVGKISRLIASLSILGPVENRTFCLIYGLKIFIYWHFCEFQTGQQLTAIMGIDKTTKNVADQPISRIAWISRSKLRPNAWNPNHVAPPELALLKISIMENGWTQPIVAFFVPGEDEDEYEIIDGEHRWRTSADPDVERLTGGLVPVVVLKGTEADRMIATIRHNRARGQHGVLPMAAIVQRLIAVGVSQADIERRLQMEDEEVERLNERGGVPDIVSRQHAGFNKGWVPGKE